jgi:hypothetical protein
MKNRLEYKYLVPLQYMDELRKHLLHYLDYDSYASVRPTKEYTVRSIYFDSFDYKCYYEKLDGIHTRKKFRVRGYNNEEDHSKIFFEIKYKYDNFISKDRAGIEYKNKDIALTDPLAEQYFPEIYKPDIRNFLYHYNLRRLEPKVLIVYDREPFECKFGSQLRITFDKKVRSKIVSGFSNLFDNDDLVESFKKEFVFEVKFFQVLPQWIDRVLNKFDLTRIAVSKYTSSIDNHNVSKVSTNKFNRIEQFVRTT